MSIIFGHFYHTGTQECIYIKLFTFSFISSSGFRLGDNLETYYLFDFFFFNVKIKHTNCMGYKKIFKNAFDEFMKLHRISHGRISNKSESSMNVYQPTYTEAIAQKS